MIVAVVVCLVFVLVAIIVTRPSATPIGHPVHPRDATHDQPRSGGEVSGPDPLAQPHVEGEEPLWMNEVRSALANGQKIQAIKLYRKATGAGLREAKDAVENISN